ncbi:MAG TPA: CRISPR system precrRNA processing endoribonuclease RAMP protein Cas6 [Acetivibrio sp.]|nr:CRISPR system precrRNA processing endoribonuclease RAMP protein Cas6 [Clostridium sp.]HQA57599.1 CRISPR system precrRNA processing endoribonuclease RAMP protein Cas6 [Acetivibrio sp.]
MDFYFSRFRVVAKFLEDANLPRFKGAMLRGGFGVNLREMVCVNRGEVCEQCFLSPKCGYSVVFESRKEKQENLFYTINMIPRPFVIDVPLFDKDFYRAGETIDFYITVIGDALDYTPFLIAAFMRFMNKGIGKERIKAEIEYIAYEDVLNQHETVIFDGKSKCLVGNYKDRVTFGSIREKYSLPMVNRITVSFKTMTRIVKEGKISNSFEFESFKRSLLRRISMLYCYYCGDKEDEINRKLIDLINKKCDIVVTEDKRLWRDWKRYSTRQKKEIYLGGLVGDIKIEGDLTELYPYILLGQYLHVGKNSTFGLGKYEVLID